MIIRIITSTMRGRRLLFLKLVIILCGRSSAATSHCDMSTTARVQEGNLGQTPLFNWLGVLRVHLHDPDSVQIAVTGIVLIKMKHAIVNADDVVRIPQRVFESDSQTMFLQAAGTPWYAPPVSYVTHPEYEYSTYNSIAIIELNIDEVENYPLNPICLPTASFDTKSNLYLTGYTDENKLLEKVIYQIRHLPKSACEEFYDRAGLSDRKRVPSTYICGYAPFNGTNCVWDNGMALVSNASGWFTLLGFGIRGPGCSAPARFIDMQPYYNWINSATTSAEEMYDSPDYRRIDGTEYVPAHELFRINSSRREYKPERDYEPYPFDTKAEEKFEHFNIQAVSDDVIAFYPFNETLEEYTNACNDFKVLLYREYFEVKSHDIMGSVTFKLSMYDLLNKVCACVQLTIECENRSEAILSFKEDFSFLEGTKLIASGADQTPEELFRLYPITERSVTSKSGKWKPHSQLTPNILTFDTPKGRVLNYDLFIKFEFRDHAILKFDMYGTRDLPLAIPTVATSTEGPRPSTKKKNKPKLRKNKYWGLKLPIDKRFKEKVVTLVAKHAVVQETVSKGSRSGTFVVFVLKHFVLSFYLRAYVNII